MLFPLLAGIGALCMSNPGKRRRRKARRAKKRNPADYRSEPLGRGLFYMVPSGDIVRRVERNRRLKLGRKYGKSRRK